LCELKTSPLKTTTDSLLASNFAALAIAPPVPSGSFSTAYNNFIPHLAPSPKYGMKSSDK
jgi:hypothetical protein